MATNTRFATGMHTLVLLARQPETVLSSETLAARLQTNAVVVRRVLAVLQKAGLVRNTKGPSGGSRLLLPPSQITLASIYRALDAGPLFHDISVKTAEVRRTGGELRRSFQEAENAMMRSLESVTLQSVVRKTSLKKS